MCLLTFIIKLYYTLLVPEHELYIVLWSNPFSRGRPTVNQVMWTLKLLALTDRLYRAVHQLQLVIGVGHCLLAYLLYAILVPKNVLLIWTLFSCPNYVVLSV